jgi:hypothetical protein
MRELSAKERNRVKSLTDKSVEFALIQPTKTGLEKSILDATGAVRNYLSDRGVHEYARQAQGYENRKQMRAFLLGDDEMVWSTASLYRPQTKKGDPRIWFSNLRRLSDPDDILALIVDGESLYVVNITKSDIAFLCDRQRGPIGELVNRLAAFANAIPNELLAKLRALAAAGPLTSVMDRRADTAIGRTIETALGISMNARPEPDYKGIELKSSRDSAKHNRRTLFAKVPDWQTSNFKSSAALLDAFGYDTPTGKKLNCTVSSRGPNPQSLYLSLDRSLDRLDERSNRRSPPHVATWSMQTLRNALVEKHNETFWITADCSISDDREKFQLRSVCHTRQPILPQFDLLIEQGEITVDHLIKRSKDGRVSERGPLFKISPRSFPLLFPPSKNYDLL